MTVDEKTKELVSGLRERAEHAATEGNMTATCDARYFTRAADALEALAGERDRLKEILLLTAHTLKFYTPPELLKTIKEALGDAS